MFWPFTPEARRRRLLRRAPPGPMRDYLAVPFPKPSADYRQVSFVAVDLETTGLNPTKDHILSVGWVCLEGNRIDLGSARHRLVHSGRAIAEASAVIHQITDDEAARGEPLGEVLPELLADLAGKVMIAHHAAMERRFLNAACRRKCGTKLPLMVVDTQALARRTFERRHLSYKGSDLRLHALGERYNLPRYNAHNALSDALAAAELFLAQVAAKDGGRGVKLRDLFDW